MKYQLHDVPNDIWAYVKARAHVEELTINDFIISVLIDNKQKREGLYTGEDNTYIKRPDILFEQ